MSLLFAPQRGLLRSLLERRGHRANLRGSRVLLDLYRIALSHDDPFYAAETGMLRSFYGVAPNSELQRLAAQGLVERLRHMPEEGDHWALTPAGQERAEELLAGRLGHGDADSAVVGSGGAQ